MFTNISGGIAQIKAEVPRKSRYGVIGKNHYYPFGMPARPKSYGGGEQAGWIANPTPPYAYKYNGKELNIDFGLNLSDYGARWYDAGVGRFTSIDRYAPKYASLNPYQYGANNPIKYIDVNGDSLRINTGGGNYAYYDNGNVYNRDGSQYTGPGTKVRKDGSVRLKGELKATVNALNQISGGGTAGNELVSSLVGTTTTFTINQGDNRTQGLNVYFNSSSTEGGLDASGSNSRPAYIGLAHELAHALDIDRRTIDYNEWFKTETGVIRTNAEKFASNYENRIRSENGLSLRAYYSSGVYPPAALLNGPSAKYPTNYYNANSLPRREILSVSSSNQ
ncbi:MAG: hypothetical protein IPF93_00270 [Saprospiraceae bacterium]|nr:hypothetical protein [Saprospiraceae bacterium]